MYQRIIMQVCGCNQWTARRVVAIVEQEVPNGDLSALTRNEIEDLALVAYRLVEYDFNIVGEA